MPETPARPARQALADYTDFLPGCGSLRPSRPTRLRALRLSTVPRGRASIYRSVHQTDRAKPMDNMEMAPGNDAQPPPRDQRRSTRSSRPWSRHLARWMFHGHLWLGVLGSMALIVVCVTGVLLNHKRPLGLMQEVSNPGVQPLSGALTLHELAARAGEAIAPGGQPPAVDRIDVRPSDGLAKVRYKDRVVTEVTLNLATGSVLHLGERNDVFLEKLHSGEIFGDRGILISDAAALALTLLLLSGYWLWLYPRRRT